MSAGPPADLDEPMRSEYGSESASSQLVNLLSYRMDTLLTGKIENDTIPMQPLGSRF
jgi:hypothetical protein